MSDKNVAGAAAEPQFELNATRQFVPWLIEQNISLGFSTYQSGKILLVGHNSNQQLSIFERTFERPMGLWSDGQNLLASSSYQLHRFSNTLTAGDDADGYDCLYVPQVNYITGDIDMHDIAVNRNGTPVFVNSLFSCLATVSETASFKPLWKPDFITELQPEDRCHLNGLAMENGKPKYISALGTTDTRQGWRDNITGLVFFF